MADNHGQGDTLAQADGYTEPRGVDYGFGTWKNRLVSEQTMDSKAQAGGQAEYASVPTVTITSASASNDADFTFEGQVSDPFALVTSLTYATTGGKTKSGTLASGNFVNQKSGSWRLPLTGLTGDTFLRIRGYNNKGRRGAYATDTVLYSPPALLFDEFSGDSLGAQWTEKPRYGELGTPEGGDYPGTTATVSGGNLVLFTPAATATAQQGGVDQAFNAETYFDVYAKISFTGVAGGGTESNEIVFGVYDDDNLWRARISYYYDDGVGGYFVDAGGYTAAGTPSGSYGPTEEAGDDGTIWLRVRYREGDSKVTLYSSQNGTDWSARVSDAAAPADFTNLVLNINTSSSAAGDVTFYVDYVRDGSSL